MTPAGELSATLGVDRDSPLASPTRRFVAHLIDHALFHMAATVLLFALLVRNDGGALLLAAIGGAGTLGLSLATGWSVQRSGQSLGKRLLGLRVVRADGRRIALGRVILLRNLLPGLITAVPIAGLIFAIADCLFVLRDDGARRSLHDRMANSIVISLRSASSRAVERGSPAS